MKKFFLCMILFFLMIFDLSSNAIAIPITYGPEEGSIEMCPDIVHGDEVLYLDLPDILDGTLTIFGNVNPVTRYIDPAKNTGYANLEVAGYGESSFMSSWEALGVECAMFSGWITVTYNDDKVDWTNDYSSPDGMLWEFDDLIFADLDIFIDFGDTSYTWQIEAGSLPVPEPSTILLLSAGLAGVAGFRKKFKKA